MSRRYWIAIIAAGLASLVIFAGYTSYRYQRHNAENQRHTAEQYGTSRDHQLRATCAVVPHRLALECVSEQSHSEGDEAAAQYDLKAQQDMALWTLGMLWVSAFMLGVTGLGVWYVAHTLHATHQALRLAKKANKAAHDAVEVTRDIGMRGIRAYLVIDATDLRRDTPLETPFHVRCSQRNLGRTFAKNVNTRTQAFINLWPLPEGHSLSEIWDSAGSGVMIPPEAPNTPVATFGVVSGGLNHAHVTAVRAGTMRLYVVARVDYVDVFEVAHFTQVCVSVSYDTGAEWLRFEPAHLHNEAS